MRVMRRRFLGLIVSGGDTGVAGAGRVATCRSSSDADSCTRALCDGGGVLGATAVAVFCCVGAISADLELNSWPSRGLRLSKDLWATCQ